MNKTDWMKHHGLTIEEMAYLEYILKLWDGKIVAVVDNKKREVLRP